MNKETKVRISRISVVVVLLAVALGLAACGGSSSSSSSGSSSAPASSSASSSSAGGGSGTINGAGSTLAAPIYQQWGSTLAKQGLVVNYQATGSGAGVAALQAGTVDFAGSDPPMKPSEIKAAKGPVAMFPVAFGAITVSYHVSGLKSGLKLDGPTIANIFLGKIKTWNDPAIKSLNPGMSLPSTSITVVHRSDSSGTTKGFTTFLSAYSPAWTAAAGPPDKIVKWPTGTGAKGNAGVAAAIQQTSGAIGYLDQAYALQNNFTFAAVKNKAGHYVRGGGGNQDPRQPGDQHGQLGEPERVPDRVADVPDHLQGHVQGGPQPGGGRGCEEVHRLRPWCRPSGREAAAVRAAAPGDPRQGQGAAGHADLQRFADSVRA
jgi:phosphate ABC transporter phosphate-binding protein